MTASHCHTLTQPRTHTHTHRETHRPIQTHINIYNYNLISGHELQPPNWPSDRPPRVPLTWPHSSQFDCPLASDKRSHSLSLSFSFSVSVSLSVSFSVAFTLSLSVPAVSCCCLRVSARLSLPAAHKLFAHPLITFTHTHTQLVYTSNADNVKQQQMGKKECTYYIGA